MKITPVSAALAPPGRPNSLDTPFFEGAVAPPVRNWLRAEGLAGLAVSVVGYAHLRASWWLFFAALLLLPDLSMTCYPLNPRAGGLIYNLAHNYFLPLTVAAIVFTLHFEWLLPYLLIWTAHIGLDRMLGYGLKYPASFGHTPGRARQPGRRIMSAPAKTSEQGIRAVARKVLETEGLECLHASGGRRCGRAAAVALQTLRQPCRSAAVDRRRRAGTIAASG